MSAALIADMERLAQKHAERSAFCRRAGDHTLAAFNAIAARRLRTALRTVIECEAAEGEALSHAKEC